MNELHKKVNEIKMKVLNVLEKRVNDDTSLQDLQQITLALNNVDDDKNFYLKMLGNLSGTGFNGKASESLTKESKTSE